MSFDIHFTKRMKGNKTGSNTLTAPKRNLPQNNSHTQPTNNQGH
jgi:hypothetical protein